MKGERVIRVLPESFSRRDMREDSVAVVLCGLELTF